MSVRPPPRPQEGPPCHAPSSSSGSPASPGYNTAQALLGRRLAGPRPVALAPVRHPGGRAAARRRPRPRVARPRPWRARSSATSSSRRGRARRPRRRTSRVNGAMLRQPAGGGGPGDVRSSTSALVTGLKHYLGPFEAYASTPGRHAVPGDAGPPADRQLLLRPGGHPVRGGRSAGLHLVGAPAAHDDRLRARQRDEHGRHAGRVRRHLPRDRASRSSSPAAPSSGQRRHRHHRRAPARPPRRCGRRPSRRRATRPSTPSTATSSGGGRCGRASRRRLGVEPADYPRPRRSPSRAGWTDADDGVGAAGRASTAWRRTGPPSWPRGGTPTPTSGREVETFADMSKSRPPGLPRLPGHHPGRSPTSSSSCGEPHHPRSGLTRCCCPAAWAPDLLDARPPRRHLAGDVGEPAAPSCRP